MLGGMSVETIRTLLDEFDRTIDGVVGLYLDSIAGFDCMLDRLKATQLKILRDPSRDVDVAFLDTQPLGYFDESDATLKLHECTQGEFKERMAKSGPNRFGVANLCIVSLYQHWEDHFRKKIAEAIGVPKNDVKSPVFGELNGLRRSIVHNDSLAVREVSSNALIATFVEGQPIALDEHAFHHLISQVRAYVSELRSKHAAASGE